MRSYETECEEHKLSLHPDKVVFSRAWASLPAGLQIFKLFQDGNGNYRTYVVSAINQFLLRMVHLIQSETLF